MATRRALPKGRKVEGTPEELLRTKLARGNDVTLVLGAGVAFTRGIPGWAKLAATLCERAGVAVPEALKSAPGSLHPLALPIAFELAERATLRRRGAGTRHAPFEALVRDALYATLAPGSSRDTLGVLAGLVRREQAEGRGRRVRRVITFNADDLFETEANGRHDPLAAPVVWPVTREAGRPRMQRGANGAPPVPVYHVHGFLPRARGPLSKHEAAHALVFTEAQYWRSFAEPTTFPNRVLMSALHDSVCVFIGLSMTDLNIARWLGMRANAIERENVPGTSAVVAAGRLRHHFWVRGRPAPASAEEFVTPILQARGVSAIDLEGWGAPFEAWVERCFGEGVDAPVAGAGRVRRSAKG
ncbi:MAG: SIR2 family protein [Polyangiaceae bacterium]